ncbi:MAG TPA: sigma-54-dependent Fis family transcriptional regulator [Nitrospirae bacterium]|nr:transcriptional regulatory protein ZraR [bacterium BMS3Abin10]GBE39599.1 transcriptional regulatory protein ZraR [bacterium BMS3Bbin08]HDH51059.1 sigma-54-dependent Fis family transcriptional regulator [Nitrospirota bacterium]HDK17594.1 sigma-54-dependent Fis family transcriptional regulator [Nitrospirota bacterium]HDO25321.1 sigma-54-dependent Fis family transcriptional regulator [Nitrospirota bacterium]
MRKPEILIVDDSKTILAIMRDFLEEEGYSVKLSLSAEEALPLIMKKDPDLVIMDVKMPGMKGLDALLEIKKIAPKLSVIIMTAHGTTQTAIEAMKKGAYDYITKPFKNKEFKALIRKALEAGRLMKESVTYQTEKSGKFVEGTYMVGSSPEMLEIYKTIGKVADSNATVLIRGESGTGKELVARAVYQNSSRSDKPFLAVNCAAIPESLLESELFGHEKGAFTGAVNRRIGKFEQCNGGTIFLDEIGDMTLSTQTKILRVLQEHTFEPVGSEKTMKMDVRVIASTNRDLWKAIEKGQFREDLYYRLKVITIYMPPLRHRREDISLLVDYFIQKFNREFNKNIKKVSPDVMEHLRDYKWPGNIRELENAVQAAVVMSKKDVLLPDNFSLFTAGEPDSVQETRKPDSAYEDILSDMVDPVFEGAMGEDNDLHRRVMGKFEKSLIDMVLNRVGKSQTRAAKVLGISRNTLRARMKEFGLMG